MVSRISTESPNILNFLIGLFSHSFFLSLFFAFVDTVMNTAIRFSAVSDLRKFQVSTYSYTCSKFERQTWRNFCFCSWESSGIAWLMKRWAASMFISVFFFRPSSSSPATAFCTFFWYAFIIVCSAAKVSEVPPCIRFSKTPMDTAQAMHVACTWACCNGCCDSAWVTINPSSTFFSSFVVCCNENHWWEASEMVLQTSMSCFR